MNALQCVLLTALSVPGAINAEPLLLDERRLDTITAGAVSSQTLTGAFASGPTYAATNTRVETVAIARKGHWLTTGEGIATARGDGLASTAGSSTSRADSTGIAIGGAALAAGDDARAYTKVWSKAIDTRYVDIAIGHVRSVACCGSKTDANVEATSFSDKAFSVGHTSLTEVDTPYLSTAIGQVVIVSVERP